MRQKSALKILPVHITLSKNNAFIVSFKSTCKISITDNSGYKFWLIQPAMYEYWRCMVKMKTLSDQIRFVYQTFVFEYKVPIRKKSMSWIFFNYWFETKIFTRKKRFKQDELHLDTLRLSLLIILKTLFFVVIKRNWLYADMICTDPEINMRKFKTLNFPTRY